MKSFRQIRESIEGKPRIIASEKFTVYRDGGSHGHEVLNPEECGYVTIIQDFSFHAKKSQNEGKFFGMLPPPNHVNNKWEKIEYDSIDWV
jgi:hypothetical protein